MRPLSSVSRERALRAVRTVARCHCVRFLVPTIPLLARGGFFATRDLADRLGRLPVRRQVTV